MNEINFLPESFIREQGRKARIYREAVLIVIVALSFGAWGLTSWRQLAKAQSWLESRQAEAESLASQSQQVAMMDQRYSDLKHQVRIQQELMLPLDLTSVVATIGQTMSDPLAITEMSLVSTMPKPVLRVARSKKQDDPNATAKRPPREPQVMRIELIGLSPTDGDVADFVEKLTSHPIFSSVKLHYTRPTRVSNVAARKFRIELEVSLDCRYLPTDEQAVVEEGVAHAG